MKYLLSSLILFIANLTMIAQQGTVEIHIKLVNGLTGLPMKNQVVELEEDRTGAPHTYTTRSARTNASGIATIRVDRDLVILTENTHEYVDCGEEHGGLVHNDYKVSDIVFKGIVEPVALPNLCTKTSGSAKPGELLIFVRPWMPGEEI